jgi:uncharacterized membrane protein YphA (DoxX/SURF4 family)
MVQWNMFAPFRLSQMILRIGLALVFLWSGIDMVIEPRHWIASGMPFTLFSVNAIVLIGLFKVLVAISLVTGFFIGLFASVASLFLAAVFIMSGPNESSLKIWD